MKKGPLRTIKNDVVQNPRKTAPFQIRNRTLLPNWDIWSQPTQFLRSFEQLYRLTQTPEQYASETLDLGARNEMRPHLNYPETTHQDTLETGGVG